MTWGHGSTLCDKSETGTASMRDERRSGTVGGSAVGLAALLATAAQTPGANAERDFLSRVRRLTVEGRRAGEGYWSPDGKRLVFQSEREPGNPFYQIYTVDLTTGQTFRISPGMGKTTCAFFRPGTDQILFVVHPPRSQIEATPGRRARVPRVGQGTSLRLGLRSRDGDLRRLRKDRARSTRLTNARGYDAEASYSPDGQWIVFSSMRDAYNRALTDAEKKQLERRSQLLRRDLHHARRRIGPASADKCQRLRRRAILLTRRQADRLAPLRRAGTDCRRVDDERRTAAISAR